MLLELLEELDGMLLELLDELEGILLELLDELDGADELELLLGEELELLELEDELDELPLVLDELGEAGCFIATAGHSCWPLVCSLTTTTSWMALLLARKLRPRMS